MQLEVTELSACFDDRRSRGHDSSEGDACREKWPGHGKVSAPTLGHRFSLTILSHIKSPSPVSLSPVARLSPHRHAWARGRTTLVLLASHRSPQVRRLSLIGIALTPLMTFSHRAPLSPPTGSFPRPARQISALRVPSTGTPARNISARIGQHSVLWARNCRLTWPACS